MKYNRELDQNPINELEDDVSLKEDFIDSNSGKLVLGIKEALNGVDIRINLDAETMHIPVVDFDNGHRIICLDVADESIMRIPPYIFDRIKFSFGTEKDFKFKKFFLYSDSTESGKKKFKATYKALMKIITKENFDPRRVINIGGNYSLYYMDTRAVIREFEDVNSTYPQGKPSNGQIGIVAVRSPDNEKTLSIRDLVDYFANTNANRIDMKKFNLYMVATARYIRAPMLSLNKVMYYITQFDEMVSTIIVDSFKFIIGGIIKEHYATFPALNFEIRFEFDPSMMSSPILDKYLDNRDLLEVTSTMQEFGYIRRKEFRAVPEDSYRKDPRLFSTASLEKLYPEELRRSGYNIMIDSQRNKFIEGLGFIKCYQPNIRHFIVDPTFCFQTQFDLPVQMMSKIDLSTFFSGSGVYDGGFDNLLMQQMMMKLVSQW